MSQNDIKFEDRLKRLEEIVRVMERGDISLDESMELFREGTTLIETCGKILDEAELQVKKIATDADGNPLEEDFEYEA